MLLDVFLFTPCFRQFTHIHLNVEVSCIELIAHWLEKQTESEIIWFERDQMIIVHIWGGVYRLLCSHLARFDISLLHSYALPFDFVLAHLQNRTKVFPNLKQSGKMNWEENWLTSVDLSSPSSVLYKMKANPRDRPNNESITQRTRRIRWSFSVRFVWLRKITGHRVHL